MLERLKEAKYERMFEQAFPDADQPLTYDNYAEAVAAFGRTLITRDRFDDYLGGKDKALSDKAKQGLSLFMELGCAECHGGAFLGGDKYEKMGEVNAYANTEDVGRFAVTEKEEDKNAKSNLRRKKSRPDCVAPGATWRNSSFTNGVYIA